MNIFEDADSGGSRAFTFDVQISFPLLMNAFFCLSFFLFRQLRFREERSLLRGKSLFFTLLLPVLARVVSRGEAVLRSCCFLRTMYDRMGESFSVVHTCYLQFLYHGF